MEEGEGGEEGGEEGLATDEAAREADFVEATRADEAASLEADATECGYGGD